MMKRSLKGSSPLQHCTDAQTPPRRPLLMLDPHSIAGGSLIIQASGVSSSVRRSPCSRPFFSMAMATPSICRTRSPLRP